MKRYIITGVIIVLLFAAVYVYKTTIERAVLEQKIARILAETAKYRAPVRVKTTEKSKALFIPYWASVRPVSSYASYDRIFYFGLTVNTNGIDKTETGYRSLKRFSPVLSAHKSRLVVRMFDTAATRAILDDSGLQKKISDEVMQFAKDNGFNGVALDLEISVTLQTDMKSKINNLVQQWYTSAKQHYILFSVIVYGDVTYRQRPYDLPFIANHADEVLAMAYDFHKSRGEPGPNFPIRGKEAFGYDYTLLADDFLKSVPPAKLTVIFGMYGYDWKVDETGKPVKEATALTLNEAKRMMQSNCRQPGCSIVRDELTGEMHLISSDTAGIRHEIWFEDEKSVEEKTLYMQEQGVGSFAFWADGYF